MTPNKGKELLLQVPCDVVLQATAPVLIAIPRTVENYSDDNNDCKMLALTDHNGDINENLGEDEDETTKNAITKIITKANEKHQCQIIVYLYQEGEETEGVLYIQPL
eukprot:15341896-Ditylum_brightwellii.AAC.1